MRLGIIAAAAASGTSEPALGERDAQLLRERLGLEDMGFIVHLLEPSSDMAEQLDTLLADYAGQVDDILLYVSAVAVTLEDGQCFFCLDLDNPDVGDGVHDVAHAIAQRRESRALIVIEARSEATDAASLRAAATALRDAIDPPRTGIETIVSIRSLGAHVERIPSRFTVGLLEEVDSREGSLQAKQAYAAVVQHADLGSWPHAELYASGTHSLALRDPAFLVQPAVRQGAAVHTGSALNLRDGASPAVPPPPPVRSARSARAVPTPVAEMPPEVPVAAAPEPPQSPVPPPALAPDPTPAAGDSSVLRTGAKGKGKKGEPRRPPPPSERVDAATVTLSEKRKPAPQQDLQLPKVVISATADARRRPTLRNVEGQASEPPPGRSLEDDSPPAPQSVSADAPSVSAPLSSAATSPSASSEATASSARLQKKATEWSVQDHMEAGDEFFAQNDLEASHAEFKKALGKLGTATTPARAELYVRIGNVNRRQGNTRLALSNYEKALGIVPQLSGAHAGVLDLLVEQGNWRAVQSTEDKLIASLPSGDEGRLLRLLEFGDRAAASDSADQARTRFAQARHEFPTDERPLRRLLALFEKQNAVPELIEVRRRIADFIDDPIARARDYYELAQFCLEPGNDEEEAIRLYELALDDDSNLLEALAALATILAENQEWAELERIYRKMINAYAGRDEATSRAVLAELYRKLALLFRDHLEDCEQARAVLNDDLKLRPDDLSGHLLAAEIAVELEDPAQALVHLRRSTELEPLRIETYRQLYELGERFEEPETAFLAASVIHALGAAREAEIETFESSRIHGVPAHRRTLRREAWSWLHDKKHDTALDRVMRAISPAILRARVIQLEERGKLAPLPERQDAKTSTASVVRSIAWAAQYLGVDAPAIYLDDKLDAPIAARFAKHQALVVGKAAMRGRSVAELAFLAGRHLAFRLPEHELVAHMQTIDELTACFLAGIKLTLGAAPSGPLSAIVDGLAKVLGSQITPAEFAELETAVKILTARTTSLDLGAWVASVERCATRAGFVLCGDLALSIKQVESEGDSGFSTARARIADLCAFAVSGSHMKLRQELGSTLIDATDRPRLTMPPPGL